MRRVEKAIADPAAVEAVLQAAQVCHLGLVDGDEPYVVPVSFGFRDGVLYFHSATEGRKMEILRRHPRVCFQVELDCRVVPATEPCDWGARFRSAIGYGRAEILENPEAKRFGLSVIMAHYAGPGPTFAFPDRMLQRTAVVRIAVEELSGKRSGD
jgi:nitroimidazol reductase NimA-like FMN-containing flavoprotein (pyridoxamine 5'-phosphate oxidase superfamily)